jgi:copper transport protein
MGQARWLLAFAAAWAGGAAAHAGLVASIPADGAALAAPPASIELRFTEAVTPLVVRLIGASGSPLALPVPQTAGEVMSLSIPGNLNKGLYTVSFRVISKDSHPIGGSIVFAVGERPPPPRAAQGVESTGVSWRLATIRAVRDLALLIAAGGALFLLRIARFPAERAVLAGAGATAVVAALAGIGLHGAEMLASSFWSLDAWRTGLLSSFGLSACVAAAGALLISVAGTQASGSARTALLAAGALTAVASLPLTGHAMTARPGAVAIAAIAAHGLAAAFWIGSLAALLAIMSMRTPGQAATVAVLHRFSRWGVLAVAVLVAAGVVFVVLQLGSVSELFSSDYGWLIMGKVFFLLALLGLALLNRFRWLPMLQRGALPAAMRLRWSIAAEVALVVCVIGLTAVLVQTPTPGAMAVQRGFTQKLAHKEDSVELSVQPARAGANAIVVRFHDKEGLPFDPEEVLVEIGNQAAGVEPAARPIRRVGPGHYSRDGNELAFPGEWTIDVHARMDASDAATFKARVPVR